MTSPGQRYDSLFMTFAEWDRSPSGHWVMRQHTFLDWKVLKAQAIAASKLNPRAVSAVGAKGLFQFMDPTWQEWSERKQPGDLQRAEQVLRALVRGGPRNPLFLFNLGVVLEEQGHLGEARDAWQAALAADPSFEPARSRLLATDPRSRP